MECRVIIMHIEKAPDTRSVPAGNTKKEAALRLVSVLNRIKDRQEREGRELRIVKWMLGALWHDLAGGFDGAYYKSLSIERRCQSQDTKEMCRGIRFSVERIRERMDVLRKEEPCMQKIGELAAGIADLAGVLEKLSEEWEEDAKKLILFKSRIDRNVEKLREIENREHKKVDLLELLTSRLDDVTFSDRLVEIEETGIEFSADKSAEYCVFGLPFAVETIVSNIVQNAHTAIDGQRDKKIMASLKREGKTIEMTVVNSARIDEKTAQRIDAQEFFEFGATTKKDSKGHGQGLAIVKFFVDELGGIIYSFTAPSLEGETGLAFGITVVLPAYDS